MKKLLLFFALFTSVFAASAQTADVGVIDFVSPTTTTIINPTAPIPITIRVANYGTTAVTNVTISVNIMGPIAYAFTGVYPGPFLPDSVVTITLGNLPPFQGTISCFSSATTMYSNDANQTNDIAYLCTPKDVGVDSVLNPLPRGPYSNQEVVQVRLRNYGSATATQFPVSYKLNSQTAVTETYRGLLQSGDSTLFTFATTLDASQDTSMCDRRFKAYTALTNDSQKLNDTSYTCSITNIAVSSVLLPDFSQPVIQIQTELKNEGTVARTAGNLVARLLDQNQNILTTVQSVDTILLSPGVSNLYTFPGSFSSSGVACIEVDLATADDEMSNNSNAACRQLTTGITEVNNKAISVYPNPATGTFSISGTEPATVMLLNLTGQQVKEWQKTNELLQADVAGIATGVYLLKIKMKDEIKVLKLVVK